MTVPTGSTLLSLTNDSGFELGPWAARGITMTLEPVAAAGNIRRDINGTNVNLSAPQMRKYKATISCTDQESPGFAAMTSENPDGIWPGDIFTVVCLPQLGSATPLTLTMMVMAPGWQESFDEYNAANGWSLELEEV